MTETENRIGRRSTIEELGKTGRDVRNQMDWLNKEVYGMTFDEALRLRNERKEETHEPAKREAASAGVPVGGAGTVSPKQRGL